MQLNGEMVLNILHGGVPCPPIIESARAPVDVLRRELARGPSTAPGERTGSVRRCANHRNWLQRNHEAPPRERVDPHVGEAPAAKASRGRWRLCAVLSVWRERKVRRV